MAGRPKTPLPVRHCKKCGAVLFRKRRPSGNVESVRAFMNRDHCDRVCAGVEKPGPEHAVRAEPRKPPPVDPAVALARAERARVLEARKERYEREIKPAMDEYRERWAARDTLSYMRRGRLMDW